MVEEADDPDVRKCGTETSFSIKDMAQLLFVTGSKSHASPLDTDPQKFVHFIKNMQNFLMEERDKGVQIISSEVE